MVYLANHRSYITAKVGPAVLGGHKDPMPYKSTSTGPRSVMPEGDRDSANG